MLYSKIFKRLSRLSRQPETAFMAVFFNEFHLVIFRDNIIIEISMLMWLFLYESCFKLIWGALFVTSENYAPIQSRGTGVSACFSPLGYCLFSSKNNLRPFFWMKKDKIKLNEVPPVKEQDTTFMFTYNWLRVQKWPFLGQRSYRHVHSRKWLFYRLTAEASDLKSLKQT